MLPATQVGPAPAAADDDAAGGDDAPAALGEGVALLLHAPIARAAMAARATSRFAG